MPENWQIKQCKLTLQQIKQQAQQNFSQFKSTTKPKAACNLSPHEAQPQASDLKRVIARQARSSKKLNSQVVVTPPQIARQTASSPKQLAPKVQKQLPLEAQNNTSDLQGKLSNPNNHKRKRDIWSELQNQGELQTRYINKRRTESIITEASELNNELRDIKQKYDKLAAKYQQRIDTHRSSHQQLVQPPLEQRSWEDLSKRQRRRIREKEAKAWRKTIAAKIQEQSSQLIDNPREVVNTSQGLLITTSENPAASLPHPNPSKRS